MGEGEDKEKRMKRKKIAEQDSWGRAAPVKGGQSPDMQRAGLPGLCPRNSWRETVPPPGEGLQKEWLRPRKVSGFHDHVVKTRHPSVVETFHPGSNHPPNLKRLGMGKATQILRMFHLLFPLF